LSDININLEPIIREELGVMHFEILRLTAMQNHLLAEIEKMKKELTKKPVKK